jgi:hypothetical protein
MPQMQLQMQSGHDSNNRGYSRPTGKGGRNRAAVPKDNYVAKQQQQPVDVKTMKAQLQALRGEDLRAVFIARQINKIGFSSAEVLRAHFTQYGPVKDVLVAHSRVKDFRQTGHSRVRPAGLGFIVMEKAADTAKIMTDGPEHVVRGVTVRVQEFRLQDCAADDDIPEALPQAHPGAPQYPEAPSVDNLFAGYEGFVQQGVPGVRRAPRNPDAGEGARHRWHSPGSDTSNY